MSCTYANRQVGLAGQGCGVVPAAGQTAYATGGMMASGFGPYERAVDAVGRAMAPAITGAAAVIAPRTRPQKRAAGLVTTVAASGAILKSSRVRAALLAGGGFALKRLSLIQNILWAADVGGQVVGNVTGGLSAQEQLGTVVQSDKALFQNSLSIPVWRSSLTTLLNRRDVLAGQVVAGRGLLFKTKTGLQDRLLGGKTWHCGVTTFRLPGRPERTISHLRSLTLPPADFYFDRPLSPQQAVGLATGRLQALDLPGFAGRVGRSENLVRPWAMCKAQLIKAAIHWPTGEME